MGKKRLRSELSLEERLSRFLDELCVDWGFCSIPPDIRQELMTSRPLTADQFAHKFLTAEGFVAEYEKQWLRRLRRRFVEKFGDEIRAGQATDQNI